MSPNGRNELTPEVIKDGLNRGMLICGKSEEVLEKFDGDCIDLIYGDPPFFSGSKYDQTDGINEDERKYLAYEDMCNEGMDEYIEKIRPVIVQCHRVLKKTGSMYLHCDWHANFRLRMLMNEIFGMSNCRNEIIWHYQIGKKSKRFFGRKHDTIYFYTKDFDEWTFNQQRQISLSPESYNKTDENGKKYLINGQGNKYYLEDGRACDDVWTWTTEREFNSLTSMSSERVGFDTQKPEALVTRMMLASSNDGEIVLDPFTGSGTTLSAAQKIGRTPIGIDMSMRSLGKAKGRLQNDNLLLVGFGYDQISNFIENEIDTQSLVEELQEDYEHYAFQQWACRQLDCICGPMGGDGGLDGTNRVKDFAIQVKQGKGGVGDGDYRDFKAALLDNGYSRGIIFGFSFSKKIIDSVEQNNCDKKSPQIELLTVRDYLVKTGVKRTDEVFYPSVLSKFWPGLKDNRSGYKNKPSPQEDIRTECDIKKS